EKNAARIVGDQVVLGGHVIAGLEEETDGSETAVAQEAVAAEDDPLRVHDGGAGGPVLERVVLEPVVVREHVVDAVTDVANAVAADLARGRGLDVQAVAGVDDRVAE